MEEKNRKRSMIKRHKKRKTKRPIVILALCIALVIGVYQYVKPVAIAGVTDGGSIVYIGRFYELMKVHAMTSEDGEYYVGYKLEINGKEVYENVELKKLY